MVLLPAQWEGTLLYQWFGPLENFCNYLLGEFGVLMCLSQAQGMGGEDCSQREQGKEINNPSLNKQLDTASLILFVEM